MHQGGAGGVPDKKDLRNGIYLILGILYLPLEINDKKRQKDSIMDIVDMLYFTFVGNNKLNFYLFGKSYFIRILQNYKYIFANDSKQNEYEEEILKIEEIIKFMEEKVEKTKLKANI